MQKFRPTSWSNLSYREVQQELAALRSEENYNKRTSANSFMQNEQPSEFR